jgi:hypothetical protein
VFRYESVMLNLIGVVLRGGFGFSDVTSSGCAAAVSVIIYRVPHTFKLRSRRSKEAALRASLAVIDVSKRYI